MNVKLKKKNYFSWQIFDRSLNIKFMKIRTMGDELLHADSRRGGRTGRPDEARGRFPQFCESA